MKMTPLGGSDRPEADGLFVDAVGKSFGDRPVVKSVSLRLKRGEVAGLLGPKARARPPVST